MVVGSTSTHVIVGGDCRKSNLWGSKVDGCIGCCCIGAVLSVLAVLEGVGGDAGSIEVYWGKPPISAPASVSLIGVAQVTASINTYKEF